MILRGHGHADAPSRCSTSLLGSREGIQWEPLKEAPTSLEAGRTIAPGNVRRPTCTGRKWIPCGTAPHEAGAPPDWQAQQSICNLAAAEWPSGLIIAAYLRYIAEGESNRKRGLSELEVDEHAEASEERKRRRRDAEGDLKKGSAPLDGEERKRKRGGEEEEHEREVDPMNPPVYGGRGRPRACKWKGGEPPFHDGGGHSSPPGRWCRKNRIYPDSEAWRSFRDKLFEAAVKKSGGVRQLQKEFFKMTRGCKGFDLVRDEGFLKEIRRLMIEEFGLEEDSEDVPEGQPFYLKLLRRMLEKAGDSDYEFLAEAEIGLPLGVLPFLRGKSNGPWTTALMPYGTFPRATTSLQSNMRSMKEEGHPRRHPWNWGEQQDPVLGQGEDAWATGKEARAGGSVVMALVGDFEKAHRRFLYREDERVYLACVVKEDDEEVYINHVPLLTGGRGSLRL